LNRPGTDAVRLNLPSPVSGRRGGPFRPAQLQACRRRSPEA
jgi:hypothetical protein